MTSIIDRNKAIMKKFETMICHQDTAVQEKLAEELVDASAIFDSYIPRTFIWRKGLFISCLFNEKIIF